MAEKQKTAAKKRRPRRKKPEGPVGLGAGELGGERPPEIARLIERVGAEGSVLGAYREPLGGHWVVLASLPVERVEPTPYQRDPSKAHVEKIARVLEKVGRFLDPIILSPAGDGRYWTPNGNHRLQALKKLGARTVVGLIVPEAEISRQILALNTEKGYNLREKSLGVVKLLRTLGDDPACSGLTEESLAFELEDAAFVTLGIAYEGRPRFSGGAYQPVLRRVDGFLGQRIPEALETRKGRAGKILELDDAVTAAVAQLKERGLESPYLKPFVVARVNPIRFLKGEPPGFDETIEKMLRAAQKFDVSKIREMDIARTGGPPPASEE
jgi:ParB family chromosome partitioning protein